MEGRPLGDLKVFHDSVVPIPVQSGPAPNGLMVQPAAREHQAERMTLHFSLTLRPEAEADLESKVAKGESVPIDSLNTAYGVKKADADALIGWLEKNGFDIEDVSPDNASIYAPPPLPRLRRAWTWTWSVSIEEASHTRRHATRQACQ
jgi:kumamolisin